MKRLVLITVNSLETIKHKIKFNHFNCVSHTLFLFYAKQFLSNRFLTSGLSVLSGLLLA